MAQIVGGLQRFVESMRDRGLSVLRAGRARWGWFDHLGRAYERYDEQRGDRLAAAMTFYGFLSFFPLVALAFGVMGYAVAIDPHARDYVTRAIADLLPGLTGQLQVDEIAKAKAGAGVLGLIGLVWGGLGWLNVWREALRSIWKFDPTGGGNFVTKRLGGLAVLFVVGAVLVASVVLSGLTTSATHQVLEWVRLAGVAGAGTVLRLVALAVAIGCNTVVFLVLFSRMSGTTAPLRSILRGALFGAVGFEGLKLVGTFLVGHVTHNPVYASFAVLVGLLVWINIASRFILFTAAWTATRRAVLSADAGNPEAVEPEAVSSQAVEPEPEPEEAGPAEPGPARVGERRTA